MPVRRITLALTLGSVIALLVALAAFGADRTVVLDGANPKATWTGAAASSLNPTWAAYTQGVDGECGKQPVNYCEDTVVNVDVPATAAAKLKVTLDGFTSDAAGVTNDFDLMIFKTDAAGVPGEFVDDSANGAGEVEILEVANASGLYLVRVVYFATAASGYTGTVEVTGAPAPAPPTPSVTETTPPAPAPASTHSPPPPPAATPTPSPTATARATPAPGTLPASGTLIASLAVDRGTRATVRRRGIRIRVRCTVRCHATAIAAIERPTARALGLGAKATRLGRARATITRAGRIPFYVKLSKKARQGFARKRPKRIPVHVLVTVTDARGGQFKSVNRTITLR